MSLLGAAAGPWWTLHLVLTGVFAVFLVWLVVKGPSLRACAQLQGAERPHLEETRVNDEPRFTRWVLRPLLQPPRRLAREDRTRWRRRRCLLIGCVLVLAGLGLAWVLYQYDVGVMWAFDLAFLLPLGGRFIWAGWRPPS